MCLSKLDGFGSCAYLLQLHHHGTQMYLIYVSEACSTARFSLLDSINKKSQTADRIRGSEVRSLIWLGKYSRRQQRMVQDVSEAQRNQNMKWRTYITKNKEDFFFSSFRFVLFEVTFQFSAYVHSLFAPGAEAKACQALNASGPHLWCGEMKWWVVCPGTASD